MRRKLFTGKKGIVDDLFDMMFVIVVIFFGVFFMYFVLAANAGSREAASVATVNSPGYQDTLLEMLNMQFVINNVTYSGAELVLFTGHNEDSDLFSSQVTSYIEKGNVKGTIVVYLGKKIDDDKVFSQAKSSDTGRLVSDPATVNLVNPENNEEYVVAFYGEKK